MSLSILIVLVLLVAIVVLFSIERVPVDVVTLALLSILVLTRILTFEQAFAGFSNEVLFVLASTFILSGAMTKTGVMDDAARLIHRVAGGSLTRVLVFVMLITAVISSMTSNTTTAALLMPAVLGVCRKSRIPPSKVLIPLAFASMLGGTCTLIGTSTNIAANAYVRGSGVLPYSFFEFTPVGLAMLAAGIVYMILLGHRLLPEPREQDTAGDPYRIGEYLSEVAVPAGSRFVGRSLAEADLRAMDLEVIAISRGGYRFYPDGQTHLAADDVLIVKGKKEDLLQIKQVKGLALRADVKFSDEELSGELFQIVEAIVMPRSEVLNKTLKEIDFRHRFGVSVMAVFRKGSRLTTKLNQIRLAVGDVLLLQGPKERFEHLTGNLDLWRLREDERQPRSSPRRIYAALVFAAAVLAGSTGLLSLPLAFLVAVLVLIGLDLLSVEQAYTFIDWRLLILIAGMTGFGTAMATSGASEFLASRIVALTQPMGVYVTLLGFSVLTMALTQPMSNAAAVLVVLPVAMSTAEQLGCDPRTFAILVTLSASLSFVTPFEPACILVYGPGGYRFRDFVVSGLPLSAIAVAVLLVLVPLLWPLRAG